MQLALPDLRPLSDLRIGSAVLAVATGVILAAHAFEEFGGYVPCPLCLQQRYAYYAAIPALIAALALVRAGRGGMAAGLFVAVAVAFIANAGLGIYQAGAEWHIWDPPAACSAPSSLPTIHLDGKGLGRQPATCGVASWRFLGLSFAGWNAVASLMLAAGAVMAAVGRRLPSWPFMRGRG
jgi:disulfide bond formation protein DsbB